MTPNTQKSTARQPLFDFGSNPDPNGSQTATLGQLLEELNYENTYRSNGKEADKSPAAGTEVTVKSLELTLNFIRDALGENLQGTTDLLPLNTVKTVKLLYLKNDSSDTQLYRRLARPDENGATMEHWEARNSTRNEYTIKIASEIMVAIRQELDATKSSRIETSLLETSKLLGCIEKENEEILAPIYERFSGDDKALARAFNHMAKVVSSYSPTQPPRAALTAPLHEKLYIYLRTLPFLHFIGEYKRHINAEEARDLTIHPILDRVKEFCNELSPTIGLQVDERTPITSIAEFPEFLSCHALGLSKLVHQATGVKSERRDLLAISNEAIKLLHAYVFHQWHRTDPEVVNLTVTDCVATLAAIRIQQKRKTTYTPKWVGQESEDVTVSRLLSHLDNARSIQDLYEEDYIPQGALQILYHRFCIVYAKICGYDQRQLAWMDFQLARHAKYGECLKHSDIDCIDQAVGIFLVFCMRSAYRVPISDELQTV